MQFVVHDSPAHMPKPVGAIKIHADYAGTADFVGTGEWAQLDTQNIQHCDYFGHLSIFIRIVLVIFGTRINSQMYPISDFITRDTSTR